MRKAICPIIKKPFDCEGCKAIGKDGKCPYMKLDDWSEETLRVMRKIAEDENEKIRD